MDLCEGADSQRQVTTESGEKLAAELRESFDKPINPEPKLPKKAKKGQAVVDLGADIIYMETSAKEDKNIEGVSLPTSTNHNHSIPRIKYSQVFQDIVRRIKEKEKMAKQKDKKKSSCNLL